MDRSPPEMFDSFYGLGRWNGETGIADLATDPFAVGQPVLRRTENGFIWQAVLFGGETEHRTLTIKKGLRDDASHC